VEASFPGHEAFYIVAPDAAATVPTAELIARFYPKVPTRRELGPRDGLYDCSKANRLLNWVHGGD
jgi:UDP-glucose 4-epimerase